MLKHKKEGLEVIKFSLHILAFILFAMGAVALMLGMLHLPNIIPKFFPESRLGHAYSVLYPTYLCLEILIVGGILISLLLGVVNFIWWKKMIKLVPGSKLMFAKLAVVTFIVPNIIIFPMILSNDVQEPFNNIRADMKNYKSGNVKTYYGPLKPSKKEIMQGPYYSEKQYDNYFTQRWKIKEEDSKSPSWIRSSLGIVNEFNPKEDEEYKVTYLPETLVICDIQPIDKRNANKKSMDLQK
ncbi:hypothetical protein [Clostridium sp. JS66]|uniref:hypothetical protein n=1 Tax=Clostridium sp. JS66 TaxID=3064705 RepID=UPI00298E2F78|nr:hypothetical protein [Clostridium sp. JS66]WPC42708.1 hypothetical protein Q6H37_04340 [Clostridium sp. JS66]